MVTQHLNEPQKGACLRSELNMNDLGHGNHSSLTFAFIISVFVFLPSFYHVSV